MSRIVFHLCAGALICVAASCGQSEESASQSAKSAPATTASLSGAELVAWIDAKKQMLIVDSRTPAEFNSGHIPGAVNIPHTQVSRRLDELKAYRDLPIVSYCERGPRAYSAERVLREAGFTQVLHLEGDMADWRKNKRPTER